MPFDPDEEEADAEEPAYRDSDRPPAPEPAPVSSVAAGMASGEVPLHYVAVRWCPGSRMGWTPPRRTRDEPLAGSVATLGLVAAPQVGDTLCVELTHELRRQEAARQQVAARQIVPAAAGIPNIGRLLLLPVLFSQALPPVTVFARVRHLEPVGNQDWRSFHLAHVVPQPAPPSVLPWRRLHALVGRRPAVRGFHPYFGSVVGPLAQLWPRYGLVAVDVGGDPVLAATLAMLRHDAGLGRRAADHRLWLDAQTLSLAG